jgi:rubrerythrin
MQNQTEDNLQTAFMAESGANRRYILFAEKAEKDGQPQIARLFRAIAMAEAVHARNHLAVIGGVGSTKDNLLAAAIGEHQETINMYPIMIDDAQVDRNDRAQQSFTWANEVEKGHNLMFERALEAVKAGETVEAVTYYVCRSCGHTVSGKAPDKCPICGASKAYEEAG